MTSERIPGGSIVAGIDGSAGGDRAADWAATQAALEHRPLTLVHAQTPVTPSFGAWMDRVDIDLAGFQDMVRAAAAQMFDDIEARVRAAHPDLAVHRLVRFIDPRQALLDVAAEAAVIVVGSRGRGPVASLLLGSVSVAVAKHASCPVVVIRPGTEGTVGHGIVVGVDADGLSAPALGFAFRMASARRVPLTVMHCFWDPDPTTVDVAEGEPGFDDEWLRLSESVAGLREDFPDVEVTLRLSRGFADRRLVHASRESELVVVGRHESRALQEVVYGSVAPTVVEHADCAVAVVPCPD